MKTTQRSKLGDICTIRTGKLDSNASVEGGKYPFFTCAQETFSIDKFAFDTEAVLLGGNNANGIFPLKYYQGKFNAYQRTYIIESKNRNKVLNKFVYFSLRPVLEYFKSASIGAATQYLTKPVLDNLKITSPDVDTQRSIIDIVYAYDELVDTNNRRMQLLEESARLLFREWFVYFKFPGHEKVKIIDGVPDEWKREKIDKLVTFKRGVEPGSDNYLESYESGSYPFYRVSDLISRNPSIFVDEQYAKKAFIKKSDLVISLDGSVGIVSIGLEGCYSTGIRKLVIKDKKVNWVYLYFLMKSHYLQGIVNAYAKGTTIQHAGEAVKHMEPILPPQNIMDLFNEIANPMLSEILVLFEENQKLAQARDLLLPRLMSGAIEA